MSTTSIITLNQLIKYFNTFQQNHFFLKDFGFGEPYDIGTSRQMDSPYMWITMNEDNTIATGSNVRSAIPDLSFTVMFMDKINDQENYLNTNGFQSDNSAEILSDCIQYLQDLVTTIQNKWGQYGVLISQDVSFYPAVDETTDKSTGIVGRIVLRTRQVNCIIPETYVDPFPTLTPTPTPSPTPTPTPTPIPTPFDDVLLYVKYEDNVIDSSNFNRSITNTINQFNTNYSPKVGFNKGSHITNNRGFKTNTTISTTIKDYSFFTWMDLKGNMNKTRYIFDLRNSSSLGWALRVSNNNLSFREGSNDTVITSLSNNTWYYVGVTVKDNINPPNRYEYSIYLNGVKLETISTDTPPTLFVMNFGYSYDGSQSLDGYADETIVWNKTLTEQEVMDEYNRSVPLS